MKLSKTLWAIQVGKNELWEEESRVAELFPTRQEARDIRKFFGLTDRRIVQVQIKVVR